MLAGRQLGRTGTSMPVAVTKGLIRGVRSTFGAAQIGGLYGVEVELGATKGLKLQLEAAPATDCTVRAASTFGPRVTPRAEIGIAPLGGGSFASSAVISHQIRARTGMDSHQACCNAERERAENEGNASQTLPFPFRP